MAEFQVFGAMTPQESDRERENRALARKAAGEGIVLLENNGVLPLTPSKIALYGPGSRMTVKGGSGSGDVNERHSVTIEEGLKNAGFTFPSTLWMDRFENKYRDDVNAWRTDVEQKIKGFSPLKTMQMFDVIHENPMPYPSCTPIREDELTDETDTAVYVLSRQAGEGRDRRAEKGDYCLSSIEEESLKLLSEHYAKLILVLNCGGVMDLSILDETRIDAVIFYGQGGMEGGNALADILCGKVSPSGKLTDTWAFQYADYPSAGTFSHNNGNLMDEDYPEGIYVGYRYFTTAGIPVRYPFGYGLSYTAFEHRCVSAETDGSQIILKMEITNTGAYAGRETVQLYAARPGLRFRSEARSLVSFGKTALLTSGQKETLALSFDLRDVSVFDEKSGQFVLEEGTYGLSAGSSCMDLTLCAAVDLDHDAVTEKDLTDLGCPLNFNDMELPSLHVSFEAAPFRLKISASDISPREHAYRDTVSSDVLRALHSLSEQERISLVIGGAYALKSYNNVMGAAGRTCTDLLKKGIPNIVLADGPAGLNVNQAVTIMKDGSPRYPEGLPEEWRWGWLKKLEPFIKAKPGKGRPVYRYMTAWPSETVMAQTWDLALMEETGCAIGREMKEIGVSVWLAPGLNIHRNPLCGRNFEYYSEDPYVSGKMAAAITKGVQSCGGIGVTIKHFLCNNQEDNRNQVSSNVSERALREIYLRGFRIAVQEGKPWCVMSSYNRVNGTYVCNSRTYCTDVLRNEWGFEGVLMSDWNATDQCSHAEAVNAGNDLIMPGSKSIEKTLLAAWKDQTLNTKALSISAARVLNMIYASDTCQEFLKKQGRK